MIFKPRSVACCLVLCCYVFSVASYSCRDLKNSSVDWFILYKIPRIGGHSNPFVASGVAFLYMDARSQQWTLSNSSVQQSKHNPLFYTLKQVVKEKFGYALYNDQPPTTKSYSTIYGHIKGMVAFTPLSGFWLSHSIPRFPAVVGDDYEYRDGETRYGQTAMCLTLGYKQFNIIGQLFQYNYPWVYNHHLDSNLELDNPDLHAYLESPHKAKIKHPPWNFLTNLTTSGHLPFTAFAKFTNYEEDLYGAWLSQYYRRIFYAETWQHDDAMPSNCTNSHKVFNIKSLGFSNEINFENSNDHSKWAVSELGNLFCIADINRAYTQLRRGGGAICIQLRSVWTQFRRAVVDHWPCDDNLYFNNHKLHKRLENIHFANV